MWILYALSGAFFKSLSGYNRKKLSHLSSAVFVWISLVLTCLILLPFVIGFRLPVIELITQHYFITTGLTLTASLAMILNVKALKQEELSFVAPLNGFVPIFTLLFAWLFINELPPIIGILGVIVIFIGTYIMALDSSKIHWYDPFLRLAKSSAAYMSLAVTILYALNIIFIKAASNAGFDALTILYASSVTGIVLFSYIFITAKRNEIIKAFHTNPVDLLAASANSLLGALLNNIAVSLTYSSFANAVRRVDTIFSVLLGWRLLKESNIKNKLIGAIIITIGAAIVAISV